MDDLFNEIDSATVLALLLTALTKEDNNTEAEGLEEELEIKLEEKLEEEHEPSVPEPVLQPEPISYIYKSSNRKRLKPKTVYF